MISVAGILLVVALGVALGVAIGVVLLFGVMSYMRRYGCSLQYGCNAVRL